MNAVGDSTVFATFRELVFRLYRALSLCTAVIGMRRACRLFGNQSAATPGGGVRAALAAVTEKVVACGTLPASVNETQDRARPASSRTVLLLSQQARMQVRAIPRDMSREV